MNINSSSFVLVIFHFVSCTSWEEVNEIDKWIYLYMRAANFILEAPLLNFWEISTHCSCKRGVECSVERISLIAFHVLLLYENMEFLFSLSSSLTFTSWFYVWHLYYEQCSAVYTHVSKMEIYCLQSYTHLLCG
jgi:hypothetical protein